MARLLANLGIILTDELGNILRMNYPLRPARYLLPKLPKSSLKNSGLNRLDDWAHLSNRIRQFWAHGGRFPCKFDFDD
jgi:hypothetical protein